MGCLFCNIVDKKVPAQVVWENEHALAFRDIRPVAPTHVLVIPKKHVVGIGDVTAEDKEALGEVMFAVHKVAAELGLSADGYRVVLNHGVNAGQSVFHLHAHVLGGRQLAWPPG